MFDWDNLQNVCASISEDVLEGKNLKVHLKNVEQAIKDLEAIIRADKSGHAPKLNGFLDDFLYLRSCIHHMCRQKGT